MNKLLLFLFIPATIAAQEPVNYVDPLIGTGNAKTISALRHSESGSEEKGQNFPAVGRPFGMTQWTPETRTTELKCISPYYFGDSRITGFRGSHWMSGSCTQDYGSMTVMPFTATRPDTVKSSPSSAYSHERESSSPYFYSVTLDDYGIKAELTGSVRSGMLRLTFPGDRVNCLYIRSNSDEKQGRIWYDPQLNIIAGFNPVHRIYQGWGKPAGFSGYFVLRFDKPFRVLQQETGTQNMVVSFGSERNVTVAMGTSFTGTKAALDNLNREIPGWDFDNIMNETRQVWNKTLSKVTVDGATRDQLVKFYTALYHCYQLPRIASDADGSYQGFAQDTLVHKTSGFEYYDDFSMWDTYRALHPLLTILEPEKTLDMIRSLILKAQQGGWMPIFPCWNNYTAAMIGDHVSTMIADAYARGITGFNTDTAYRYMRKNAFDQPSREEYVDGKGRRALQSYIRYGYIPLEDSVWDAFHRREQVSRTLEYALDDYALSGFATRTGRAADASVLLSRSQNYRNVFDRKTGYVRGRYANGTWIEPFDPFKKVNYICEGTPFQYTWYVPHDIPGLIDLMGGKKQFLRKLNEFFDGGYYWHGNETDQQAPFMFAMAGQPEKTDEWVRRIISEEYGTGPGGLSGNEDAGQMSAWLVFGMMGFYPLCPGTDWYVMTIPSFNQVKIALPGNKQFIIKTINRSDINPVPSVYLNGKSFAGRQLRQQDITNGSVLEFRFSGKP